jgi:hypothetical protein
MTEGEPDSPEGGLTAGAPKRVEPAVHWSLLALVVLAPVVFHLRWLGAAWRGELMLGAPLDDGDAIYAHRFAADTLDRVGEAWAASDSIATFLLSDLWAAAATARAYQLVDFVVLLWPARALFAAEGAFLVISMALLVLAAIGGGLMARALGAGPIGCAAGALTASASGLVMATASLGQYPQALIGPGLLFFAGLARLRSGARGGVVLAGGGAALTLLLYWGNAPILAVGVAAWGLGAWLGYLPVAPGLWRRLLGAVALAAVLVAPAAAPLFAATGSGDYKLSLVPWGTALFAENSVREALSAVAAEVSPVALLSPSSGWVLPLLPLLPLAFIALRRRRTLPWVFLLVMGGVLALGPIPRWPTWLGGHAWPELSATMMQVPRWMDADALNTEPRARNWVYLLTFQWVPLASRMRHPLRWGLLVVAAGVAIVAMGADRLALRRPRWAAAAVVAGVVWAGLIGPWPLPQSPFPGELAATLRTCEEVLLPSQLPRDVAYRMDALHDRPRWPVRYDPHGGFGAPTDSALAESAVRERGLAAAREGDVSQLPAGACVVLLRDSVWGDALSAGLGTPLSLVVPARTLQTGETHLELWRVP